MKSLRGNMLISGGGLYDPNFRHTVVLIGEHNEDGALGVVLNRALDVTVQDAVPVLGDLVAPGEWLYEGGPVRPSSPILLAEFLHPERADLSVFDAVGFLTGDVSPEVRPDLVQARIYAGYSGWAPGQLEAELADDTWIVEPARVDDVFTDEPDLLWSRVLARKGPEFREISRTPYDPTMN